MLSLLISCGIGACVDAVLKVAVPAGKTVGAKVVRTIGTAAISYAVGQEIDRAITSVGNAIEKAAAEASGVEIIKEDNGDE